MVVANYFIIQEIGGFFMVGQLINLLVLLAANPRIVDENI